MILSTLDGVGGISNLRILRGTHEISPRINKIQH